MELAWSIQLPLVAIARENCGRADLITRIELASVVIGYVEDVCQRCGAKTYHLNRKAQPWHYRMTLLTKNLHCKEISVCCLFKFLFDSGIQPSFYCVSSCDS